MPHSASIANLQTASKLILSSRLVYSQPLDLPEGVEVIRATPSAGKVTLKTGVCSSEWPSAVKCTNPSELCAVVTVVIF